LNSACCLAMSKDFVLLIVDCPAEQEVQSVHSFIYFPQGGHLLRVHALLSSKSPHFAPSEFGSCKTDLVLCCIPTPQFWLQVLQDDHADSLQSSGHFILAWQFLTSSPSPSSWLQVLPPNLPSLQVLPFFWDPWPHVSEHGVHSDHLDQAASTGQNIILPDSSPAHLSVSVMLVLSHLGLLGSTSSYFLVLFFVPNTWNMSDESLQDIEHTDHGVHS